MPSEHQEISSRSVVHSTTQPQGPRTPRRLSARELRHQVARGPPTGLPRSLRWRERVRRSGLEADGHGYDSGAFPNEPFTLRASFPGFKVPVARPGQEGIHQDPTRCRIRGDR